MTDQQFNLWLQQLSTGGAASGAPSGGPGGGGGYQPPRPGGIPTGGYGGGMGGIVPQNQFSQRQSAPVAGTGGGGGLWPGGAYPSYGRFLEGINDYLNGPRRASDLTPGYRGQNVMSTDRPLPGELGYPNMGPGNYQPRYGEPAAQFGDEANFEYRDPTIEPPALPLSGGYLGPHEGIDVPPGVFPGPSMEQFGNTPMDWGDQLPQSPDFTPSDYFMSYPSSNTAGIMDPSGGGGIYDPNSYTPYTDFGGGGDYNPPVYDPNSYTSFTDFPGSDQPEPGRGGFEPMYGGNEFGSEGSVGYGDNPAVNYAYGPNGETYMYDQNWQWLGQGGGGGGTGGGQPSTVAYGGDTPPAPGFFTPNTSAPTADMLPGTNLPNAPGFNNAIPSNGMLDSQGNVIPGTALSARDQANIINSEQFPGGGGVGQFFKDAAGNIVNAAGQIVQAAGNAVGGIINNIMNDPGYSSPDYLASMGYTEGGGTNSMWPGQASTSGFGVEGRGGSFFGGTMNFNPMGGDISGPNNPFGAGQVGRSSVGPPQGGGGPPMWGPNMGLGGGRNGLNAIAMTELIRIQKGLYPTASQYRDRIGGFKYPQPNAPPPAPYSQFLAGQQRLHDLFISNPGYFQSLLGHWTGSKGAGNIGIGGGPQKLSQHTPAIKPA